MSVPQGDLPDWQTLTSPVFQSASGSVSTLNSPFTLISSPNPFRLWQAWLGIAYQAGGTMPGIADEGEVAIKDGSGAFILGTEVWSKQANWSAHVPMAVPLYGYQPRISGGLYKVVITVAMGGTNTAIQTLGGVIFSQP